MLPIQTSTSTDSHPKILEQFHAKRTFENIDESLKRQRTRTVSFGSFKTVHIILSREELLAEIENHLIIEGRLQASLLNSGKKELQRENAEAIQSLLTQAMNAYINFKNYEKALSLAESIYVREPNSFEAAFELGKLYYCLKQNDKARIYLKKAALIPTDLYQPLSYLAFTLLRLGERSLSKQCAQRAEEAVAAGKALALEAPKEAESL